MKYDGCSGGMSWAWRTFLRRPPPWEGCCDAHDQVYALGGPRHYRYVADLLLRACLHKNGHHWLAWWMWALVRIGGHPWLPFPWRWGFLKPWPGRYE